MKVEIKQIVSLDKIDLGYATVPKGIYGELRITTYDNSFVAKEVIFAVPRNEGIHRFYTNCFADLTPEISEKIKVVE